MQHSTHPRLAFTLKSDHTYTYPIIFSENTCQQGNFGYNILCHGELSEWSMVIDLKSIVVQATRGSNPLLSAMKIKCRSNDRHFCCLAYELYCLLCPEILSTTSPRALSQETLQAVPKLSCAMYSEIIRA